MAQIGKVESIRDQNIFVTVIREEACAHCKMCTTGINEGKECTIEAINQCNAKVGDVVEIDVQANYFLRATAIMYGVPLLALMIGIIVPQLILDAPGTETISIILGLFLTALAYIGINKREKNKKNAQYLPVAIAKVE